MVAKTWYVTNNLASVHQEMSETDPGTEATASPQTGWVVGTGLTNHSPFNAQTNQASGTFVNTTPPSGTIDTSAPGDCWRSTNTYTGTFASGNWNLHFACRGVTQAGTQDGRVRYRLFRGANADGSGATQITGAQQQGGLVTNLLSSATQTSTATFNPGAFSVTDEYIFIQLAWERTGAGGMTTTDVAMRIGVTTGSRVVSADFTGVYTQTAEQGSYSISGKDAALQQMHKLTASASAYTITGVAAGITFTGQQLVGGGYHAPYGGKLTYGGTPTVAVTTAYTLTAAQGTYAISGQAANLLQGHKLTADAGAYSITGVAATLRRARILSAAAGAYAISGQAATLRKTRILVASAGSYTITGVVANLIQGNRVTADFGTYTISGKAANLLQGHKIVADAGAYSITGQAVNFPIGNVITANAGAYSIAGQAAGLLKTRILSAAAGSYSIAGQNATLTYEAAGAFIIGAAPGSYAISGQAASLLHTSLITASAGAYSISGQAATFTQTSILPAAAGAYNIIGFAAQFHQTHVIVANTGTYTITGVAAGLNYTSSRTIFADAGTYLVSGQAATLLKSKVVVASPGAYSVSGQAAALVEARILSAAAGSYGLVGQAAILLKSKILAAVAGSYAVAGQNAGINLAGNKTLIANNGTYAISGQAAQLLYGGIVVGGQVLGGGFAWPFGSAPWGGNLATPAGLYAINCISGTYLITGNNAGLHTGKLNALAGAYLITGSSVRFGGDRIFQAGTGTYSIGGQDAGFMFAGFEGFVFHLEQTGYWITGQNANFNIPTPSGVPQAQYTPGWEWQPYDRAWDDKRLV